jgi:hypothetical protein
VTKKPPVEGLGWLFLSARYRGVAALFFLRRRQRARSGEEVENSSTSGSGANKNRVSAASSTLPPMSEADGRPVSEADGKAARPWSMRSELEGSQVGGNRPDGASALNKETQGGQATESKLSYIGYDVERFELG